MRLPEVANPPQHRVPTHFHPSHTTHSFRRKHRGGSSIDVPDGVFCDADGVFCDADALPRHEFVNYMTVSHQPIGLTHDPRYETWIHGR